MLNVGDRVMVKNTTAGGIMTAERAINNDKIIEDLRVLCDFAYKQGFHEMGYDPVIEAAKRIAAASETAAQRDGLLEVLKKVNTCRASINSDVVALVDTAITNAKK